MIILNEQGASVKEEKQMDASLLHESSVNYGYREMPETGAGRLDVLEQLKTNIRQIEDLNGRLAFLLHEVQSVLKKS